MLRHHARLTKVLTPRYGPTDGPDIAQDTWLLGATDGHAKNFSVALDPGGRFRLKPLYDILSVQPLVDAGQVRHNQYKLSMAVGHNRHYAAGSIRPRHFIQTARRAEIGQRVVEAVLEALGQRTPAALEAVEAGLPHGVSSGSRQFHLGWSARSPSDRATGIDRSAPTAAVGADPGTRGLLETRRAVLGAQNVMAW